MSRTFADLPEQKKCDVILKHASLWHRSFIPPFQTPRYRAIDNASTRLLWFMIGLKPERASLHRERLQYLSRDLGGRRPTEQDWRLNVHEVDRLS